MRWTGLLVWGKKKQQNRVEAHIYLSCHCSFLSFCSWLDSDRVPTIPNSKWRMLTVFSSLPCHLLLFFYHSSPPWLSLIPSLLHLPPCPPPLSILYLRHAPFPRRHRGIRVDPAGRHFRQTLLSLSLCVCLFPLPHSNRKTARTHYLLVIGSQQPLILKKGPTLITQLFPSPFSSIVPPFIPPWSLFFLVSAALLSVCTLSLWDCSKFGSFNTLQHNILVTV